MNFGTPDLSPGRRIVGRDMRRGLRPDAGGVASTVATLLALVVVVLFMAATIVAVAPKQQHDAEYATSIAALRAFELLRAMSAGPALKDSHFSATIPLGTPAVSPFTGPGDGTLVFSENDASGGTVSFRFVPKVHEGRVTKLDQDVILIIDSSGSMRWNDPQRLRIAGAQEYIGRLSFPDRVAVVDFDGSARLTKANVRGDAHHLWSSGHTGTPDYSEAQSDVATIDSSGFTNIGDAIRVANDELLANGDPKRAWVEILLTDGQNNYRWQDDLTRQQAQRAKASGITIYTIGLSSDADAALLAEVAATTGGTYYAAPTPESIRWIYFEISRRYQGSVACGTLTTSDTFVGTLALSLGNRQYTPQTLRLEAGGVVIVQPDGAAIDEGLPFEYKRTATGSGSLALSLVTYTGRPFSASGVDYAFISGHVLGREYEELTLATVVLDEQSRSIANISSEVQYWADQGAATQPAAYAVRTPLDQAVASTLEAHENVSAGRIDEAKFHVDRAQVQLFAAIDAAETQRAQGTMQNWLARQTEDEVIAVACRLDQWQNWYEGVTISVASSVAPAWARWFNDTFQRAGASMSLGLGPGRAVISLHAIDTLLIDRRVIQLSNG